MRSLVAKVGYDAEDIGDQGREDGETVSQEETRGFVGIDVHIGGLLNHRGDVWPRTELASPPKINLLRWSYNSREKIAAHQAYRYIEG